MRKSGGHEGTIIEATQTQDWDYTDAIIEVGSADLAESIFKHLKAIGVRAFSQKTGWLEVKKFDEMPFSYKDGSLFISKKPSMPWPS